jgi:hypothetical protein
VRSAVEMGREGLEQREEFRLGREIRAGAATVRLHGEQGEPAAGAAGRKNGWGWGLLDLYPAGRADNGEEQRRLERRLDDDGGRKQISPPAVSGGQGKIAGQRRCWEQLVPRRHGK